MKKNLKLFYTYSIYCIILINKIMEYYIMEKANQFYREAMAKHGLANAVSPMIEDIVFTIVEKMDKIHGEEKEGMEQAMQSQWKQIYQLQDQVSALSKLQKNGFSSEEPEMCCEEGEECPRCSEGCPPSDK